MDFSASQSDTATRRASITQYLMALRDGDAEALEHLMPLVYDELHAMAHHKLQFERAGHSFDTTDLVHEAYLRLVDQQRVQWQSRAHFLAVAAQAMRRVLVDHARKQQALKRGGGARKMPVDAVPEVALGVLPTVLVDGVFQADQILALDAALDRLSGFNQRGCRVVEYRFFSGMTYEEIADVMGVSAITVRRSWTAAKSWLRRELLTM